MTNRAAVASTEYLRVPITTSEDPTGLGVSIACPVAGVAPVSLDWIGAEWESGGPPYICRILIGPDGDLTLDAGAYDVYVQITDSPELPAFIADRLEVFDTLASFASVAELASLTGRDLDPEDAGAQMHLRFATADIRVLCGQTLSLVADDEVELRGNWSRVLHLPERPVIDVSAVEIRWQGVTTFAAQTGYILAIDKLELPGWYWAGDLGGVRVTYSHGFAVIPDDLVGVCCSMATRSLRDPAGDLASETLVSYSYTRADVAAAGLTAREERILTRYGYQPDRAVYA